MKRELGVIESSEVSLVSLRNPSQMPMAARVWTVRTARVTRRNRDPREAGSGWMEGAASMGMRVVRGGVGR